MRQVFASVIQCVAAVFAVVAGFEVARPLGFAVLAVTVGYIGHTIEGS